jgi:hypothetical protein
MFACFMVHVHADGVYVCMCVYVCMYVSECVCVCAYVRVCVCVWVSGWASYMRTRSR